MVPTYFWIVSLTQSLCPNFDDSKYWLPQKNYFELSRLVLKLRPILKRPTKFEKKMPQQNVGKDLACSGVYMSSLFRLSRNIEEFNLGTRTFWQEFILSIILKDVLIDLTLPTPASALSSNKTSSQLLTYYFTENGILWSGKKASWWNALVPILGHLLIGFEGGKSMIEMLVFC